MSRAKAWEYAEGILDIPKRRVTVTLRHGKSGVVVLHEGRVMTRCYNSQVGRVAARYMAKALGVEVPEAGKSVETAVSTGVLFRAISISSWT